MEHDCSRPAEPVDPNTPERRRLDTALARVTGLLAKSTPTAAAADALAVAREVMRLHALSITKGPFGVMPSEASSLAHIETQEGCPGVQGFAVCSVPKKRVADAEFIAAALNAAPLLAAALLAQHEKESHGR
jgi:hypothetical protein